MATFPYDPMTLNTLMQSLPDLQKKKRRAEQLREQNKQFKEMGAKQATGTMLPTQHGGLYQTVAQYQPDVAGMANQGIGAIGDWMTGRQAEEAQGGYDEAQTQALLGMSQQMSQPQMGNQPMGESGAGAGLDATAAQEAYGTATPTAETLRLAMGMIGGPEIKDFLPKDRSDIRVQSAFTDDFGKKVLIMSDGSIRDTGKSADFGGQIVTDERNGLRYLVPKTGKFRGQYIPLGDYDAPDDLESHATGGESAEPEVTGFDNVVSRLFDREGGLNPNDSGRGPSNFGINQSANPDVDVTSLTKETATPLYKQRYWDAIDGDNVPATIQEAAFDAAVNMGPEVAKQLIAESGGDPLKFRELREARYEEIFDPSRHTEADRISWTKRNLETTGGRPAAARASVSTTGDVSGRPRALTVGEKKGAEKQAESDVEVRAKAHAGRGSLSDYTTPSINALDRLLTHPGFEKIMAGGMGSYAAALGQQSGGEKDELGLIEKISAPLYAQMDPEGADALSLMKQVIGGKFATGIGSLVGKGAGSLSNMEGTALENSISSMSTATTPAEFRIAAQAYKDTIARIDARLAKEAGEEVVPAGQQLPPWMKQQQQAAPAQAAGTPYKVPPGFTLRKKTGG